MSPGYNGSRDEKRQLTGFRMLTRRRFGIVVLISAFGTVECFSTISSVTLSREYRLSSYSRQRGLSPIFAGGDGRDNNESFFSGTEGTNGDPYSRELRLREETESPFRKVRFLVYFALLGGAFTSFLLSAARVAAALGGINEDLMQESVVNIIVDLTGLVTLGFLYKRDVEAQESRLKRAAKGAELAKLAVRGSEELLDGAQNSSISSVGGRTYITAPLASLRRGRGVEKRVILAAAGRDKITQVLQEARELSDSLLSNDLVVVPIELPQGTAPLGLEDKELLEQDNIALPALGNWRSVIADEAAQAKDQGIDVENDGFAVVLKKNGRVGQRTKGIYLDRMCGEVMEREQMGLDVKNI